MAKHVNALSCLIRHWRTRSIVTVDWVSGPVCSDCRVNIPAFVYYFLARPEGMVGMQMDGTIDYQLLQRSMIHKTHTVKLFVYKATSSCYLVSTFLSCHVQKKADNCELCAKPLIVITWFLSFFYYHMQKKVYNLHPSFSLNGKIIQCCILGRDD